VVGLGDQRRERAVGEHGMMAPGRLEFGLPGWG
jgi:hypothetical protein